MQYSNYPYCVLVTSWYHSITKDNITSPLPILSKIVAKTSEKSFSAIQTALAGHVVLSRACIHAFLWVKTHVGYNNLLKPPFRTFLQSWKYTSTQTYLGRLWRKEIASICRVGPSWLTGKCPLRLGKFEMSSRQTLVYGTSWRTSS